LTLTKTKSIREFNDHYAKKLITHVIYLNLTIQDHTVDIASMLITQLKQHQIILEKTWMNKIKLVIDMQIDSLQFLNFNHHSKSIILLSSNKTTLKQKSLTFTHILKRFFTFVTFQSSLKSFSFNQFNEKSVKLIEQLKSRNATLTNVKILKSFFNSMNIAMIKTAAYRMLVKRVDVNIFAVIILKINQLINTVKNKLKSMNLHELFHVKILKQVKIKLLFNFSSIMII